MTLTFSREAILKHVRVYPNEQQRDMLLAWMRAAQNIFNNTKLLISKQRRDGFPIPSIRNMRQAIAQSPYGKDIPIQIRLAAMEYALDDSALTWSDMLIIPANCWGNVSRVPFPNKLGRDVLEADEPLPSAFGTNTCFYRTIHDEFFLCYMCSHHDEEEEEHEDDDVIAFDPGVRTLLTGYTKHGYIVQCHEPTMEDIDQLVQWIDQNFKMVVYPSHVDLEFMTQCMQPRTRDRIIVFHREFERRITSTLTQCQVVRVDESFTTKTCSNCQYLHWSFSKDKLFYCPMCKYEADRDVNAAKNILRACL